MTEWICKGGARLPVVAPRVASGSEYVPLTSMTDGIPSEEMIDDKPPSVVATPPPATMISKILDHIGRDLRYKFLLIIFGLWALNQVCLRFLLSY